jgi:hypothetical protein
MARKWWRVFGRQPNGRDVEKIDLSLLKLLLVRRRLGMSIHSKHSSAFQGVLLINWCSPLNLDICRALLLNKRRSGSFPHFDLQFSSIAHHFLCCAQSSILMVILNGFQSQSLRTLSAACVSEEQLWKTQIFMIGDGQTQMCLDRGQTRKIISNVMRCTVCLRIPRAHPKGVYISRSAMLRLFFPNRVYCIRHCFPSAPLYGISFSKLKSCSAA